MVASLRLFSPANKTIDRFYELFLMVLIIYIKYRYNRQLDLSAIWSWTTPREVCCLGLSASSPLLSSAHDACNRPTDYHIGYDCQYEGDQQRLRGKYPVKNDQLVNHV